MGHSEIAQTPAQTGDYVLGGGEQMEEALGQLGVCRALPLAYQCQSENGSQQQRRQHNHALEEVRPAHGREAAQEGVGNDDEGGQIHGGGGIHVHYRVEQGAAGLDGGGGVDRVGHQENHRAQHLQGFLLLQEPVGQILGDGDGVLGGDGEPAQPGGLKNPAQGVADAQTDGNPGLADAKGVNGGGQTHEHPGAHVGSTGGQGGHPGAHVPASQEIVLLAGVLGFQEEKHADAQHKQEVGNEYQHFDNIHSKSSFLPDT